VKKIIALGLAILLLLSLGVGGAFAQDQNPNASAKATAEIANLSVISASATSVEDAFDFDSSEWDDILTQTIKTANDKDLFIDVSLLSGLYTKTNVKSKGGNKDTSAAAAAVLLAVTVDGELAFPGYPIIFNARYQELSATLQGIIDVALVDDEIQITILAPEEIGLIIGTLSANSFNFIVQDLDSGMHEVVVWAKCVSAAYRQSGDAAAVAMIGLGSVTIEEVRMVRGEDAVPDV